jgi:hypothetical protein
MRTDFPRISVLNPKAYSQLWRDENRAKVREYNRLYAIKRRAKAKLAAKRAIRGKKNGK